MLSKSEVIIRYVISFILFSLSGTGLITGWLATLCGVFGTIHLTCALLRYSPLYETKPWVQTNVVLSKITVSLRLNKINLTDEKF